MKRKFNRWLKGAFISSVVIAGLTSCADDHFDINPSVSGRNTLWENISSNEDLSEFADILQRVRYSKSEGITTVETYADLFSNNQTFTVWAPKNGSFDYEKYDALLETGDPLDAYRVEKELIRNSMVRFSYVMTGNDSIKLELFNSKTAVFNCGKATMKGQQIITPNIGSSNGILHVIDGAVAYQPNMYEYISNIEGLDSLYAFLNKYQKTEFSENLSTSGPTVDGLITWVDSVFVTNNEFLNSIQAYLTREDSSYVMILPTNDAWTTALSTTRKYYNYKNSYKQDVATTTTAGKDTLISGVETVFTQLELDSIVEFRSKAAIARNLVFNANTQWGKDHNDFAVEGACDSLKTTTGQIFYDPFSARLFAGASPVEVSNGYAYVVNTFNYRPEDSWAYDKIYETENFSVLESSDANCIANTASFKISDFTALEDSFGIQTIDTVISYSAFQMSPKTSTSQPGATFMLKNTLSCKYDIYVLMAYNSYDNKPNKFQVAIAYDTESKREKNERLKNPNEGDEYYNTTYFVNKAPYIDETGRPHYVDSVLVAKDFELPVCYEGLDNAYVTLNIKSNLRSSERNKYSRELLIDKIVLKAKEN